MNSLSFLIIAFLGLLMNTLIAKVYGSEDLGVFNQVYAIFIVSTQLAVCGSHYSVGKHLAECSGDYSSILTIVASALSMCAFTSAIICLILFSLRHSIDLWFNSQYVSSALMYSLPGLWCFSLNKVLLGAINGLRRMKMFALMQVIRYFFLVSFLLLCLKIEWPGKYLAVIFSGSELVLLFILIVYFSRYAVNSKLKNFIQWFKRHLNFGFKASGIGILHEMNLRIDVIMLGAFLSDALVGLYSFASMVVEGIVQFMIVVRSVVNPKLTQLYASGKMDELQSIISQGVRMFYPFMMGVGILSTILYSYGVSHFLKDDSFVQSIPVFIVLMIGVVACSGYFPFKMLLLQTGYSGRNTLMAAASVLINILMNVILIPLFGMIGSAMATGISLFTSIIIFKKLAYRTIGIKI